MDEIYHNLGNYVPTNNVRYRTLMQVPEFKEAFNKLEEIYSKYDEKYESKIDISSSYGSIAEKLIENIFEEWAKTGDITTAKEKLEDTFEIYGLLETYENVLNKLYKKLHETISKYNSIMIDGYNYAEKLKKFGFDKKAIVENGLVQWASNSSNAYFTFMHTPEAKEIEDLYRKLEDIKEDLNKKRNSVNVEIYREFFGENYEESLRAYVEEMLGRLNNMNNMHVPFIKLKKFQDSMKYTEELTKYNKIVLNGSFGDGNNIRKNIALILTYNAFDKPFPQVAEDMIDLIYYSGILSSVYKDEQIPEKMPSYMKDYIKLNTILRKVPKEKVFNNEKKKKEKIKSLKLVKIAPRRITLGQIFYTINQSFGNVIGKIIDNYRSYGR